MRRALLCCVVLLGVLVTACGSGRAGHFTSYVALGDSYTSGPEIPPVEDATCLRSGANYPSLLAKRLHIRDFTDVSCAGAKTLSLTNTQVGATGTAPAQLDALSKGTDLVTLSIGLNDNSIAAALLFGCLTTSRTVAPACTAMLKATPGQLQTAAAQVARRVAASLKEVRKRAPHARIVLVGYPSIGPAEGSCPDRWPVSAAYLAQVHRFTEAVNKAYATVAARARATFVDLFAASKGHDVCSDDPWVNGIKDAPGKAAPLHPLAVEQQAAARAIARALR